MIWVNTSHLLKQAGRGWFPPHSPEQRALMAPANAAAGWAEQGGGPSVGWHGVRAAIGPGQASCLLLTSHLLGRSWGFGMWQASRETLAIEESTSWADCYPLFSTAGSYGGISMSASAGREQPLSACPSVWTWQIKCASCAWWYCCVLLPWAPVDAALACLMTREELLGQMGSSLV